MLSLIYFHVIFFRLKEKHSQFGLCSRNLIPSVEIDSCLIQKHFWLVEKMYRVYSYKCRKFWPYMYDIRLKDFPHESKSPQKLVLRKYLYAVCDAFRYNMFQAILRLGVRERSNPGDKVGEFLS